MSDDSVFLRPEAKLEPLVSGWNAWLHLVSPLQHAMNVTYRHVPLMQSFVKNPAVHVAAAANRKLFSGPFVHLAPDRVPDVQVLLERTQARSRALIQLAHDVKELDRKLQEGANGYSLSQFYEQSPRSMAGLVEFLYDTNNNPRMRFQDELLHDEYYSTESQEFSLSCEPDELRTFFMSTPRLPEPHREMLRIPFADGRVDRVASMRTQAGSFANLTSELGVSADRIDAFRSYFTTEPPPRAQPEYCGDGVRVRYFGHACVLIQTRAVTILIDPSCAWTPNEDGRFTFCDFPDKIDFVVLSHGHQDHVVLEALIQLRHRIGCIIVPRNNSGSMADPSLKLILTKLGFRDVRVADPFDEIAVPDGRITTLPFPGEHVDLDIFARQGILVQARDRRFAFLVDSDGWDSALFRRIAGRIGKRMDAIFIGMECDGAPLTWLYGPLLTQAITRKNDESRRLSGMDSARAWNAVREFDVDRVLVYAMGQEPWLRYIMGLEYSPDSLQLKEAAALLERCHQQGIEAERLFLKKEIEY